MVKIVSDSTCDLTDELLAKYDIKMVPLHIVLGTQEYRDRSEITQDEIFEWAEANKTTPKTSAISYSDAMEVIKPIIEDGDEVIAFVISEPMSTTGNVFRMVAQDTVAPERVHVFDTQNLSNGVGILAVEASIMAQKGMTAAAIIEELEKIRPLVNTSFVVDTLTYLARGGRCSSVVALAGGVLKLHPKIFLEGGAMDVGKKYRGAMHGVVLSYIKDMEEELLAARKDRIFLVSAKQDPEVVGQVREYLESLNHFDEILETVAGGVISSHCGPGTLGVIFINGDK